MRKSVLVLFCGILLSISLWGITVPTTSFAWLMSANPNIDVLRILLAGVLLLFAFVDELQTKRAYLLCNCLGLALLGLAASSFWYGSDFNAMGLQLMPLDVLTLIEGGIMTLLISLESAPEPNTAPATVEVTDMTDLMPRVKLWAPLLMRNFLAKQ